MMNEIPSFSTERVDDIPLLLHQIQHLGLAQIIDNHLRPHGNRQGLTYGQLACVWLTHILSEADHRMNQVRGGAQARTQTLQALLKQPLQETDCTDDRLADLLHALSDDEDWEALQIDLNRRTLAVYELPTEVVRLDARLAKAAEQLSTLMASGKGKRTPTDVASAEAAVHALLTRHQVEGLLTAPLHVQTNERSIRGYGGKPDRVEQEQQITLLWEVNAPAVETAKALLGWRVFVTNASLERLSLSGAVLLYREEYRIEHGFARLKGHPLSLSPLYVQREDHAKGLIRLLALGLRILTLLEFVVRRRLAEDPQPLLGLYAGNPKRATLMPTVERLLEAFKEITLLILPHSEHNVRYLTPLTPLQQRILELVGVSTQVYTRLCDDSHLLAQKMSDPMSTHINRCGYWKVAGEGILRPMASCGAGKRVSRLSQTAEEQAGVSWNSAAQSPSEQIPKRQFVCQRHNTAHL